ncbi:MAG: dihydrodipicolinate reductase [Pseudomonadota bacterium]
MKSIAFAATLSLAGIAPAVAEEFTVIDSRDTFLSLVDGRELTRLGIRLEVTPDGRIEGRAFGTPVTGAWQWDGGYFCRDLFYGDEDLGPNCQQVTLRGSTIRFTSDRGTGEYADLRLR